MIGSKFLKKITVLSKVINFIVAVLLFFSHNCTFAQVLEKNKITDLPRPGTLISMSPVHSCPVLRGVRFDPQDPLNLEFILDSAGDKPVDRAEISRLVRYFLAGLTMPEDDLWVNLSPYEKNRIIPESLSYTDLGENMLEADYLLKQLSSSLTYPVTSQGKEYWDEIAKNNNATSNFQKIWIMPGKAVVYQNKNAAFIAESKLKVLTGEDYLAVRTKNKMLKTQGEMPGSLAAFKTHILPLVEKEINHGERFSDLRQIYHSLILAIWFKDQFKKSFYRSYINHRKVSGIELEDKTAKDKIFDLYVKAFEQGAYNYTKRGPAGGRFITSGNKIATRKYFSGGLVFTMHCHSFVAPEAPGEAAVIEVRQQVVPARWFTRPLQLVRAALARRSVSERQPAGVQRSIEGLNIMDAGEEDREAWQAVVRERWQTEIDYGAWFAKQNLVILGDTDHGLVGLQRGLNDQLRSLKEAGVTHLAMEVHADADDPVGFSDYTALPHRSRQLVEECAKQDIKVVFIDMPFSQRNPSWSEQQRNHERGVYMGRALADLIKGNPDAKVAALVGYAHLDAADEIPLGLEQAGVPYRSVAVISEGQSLYFNGKPSPLGELTLVRAIEDTVTPGDRYGYLDLAGLGFPVSGVIHFPRPIREALHASALPRTGEQAQSTTALATAGAFAGLARIEDGQLTQPLAVDFKDWNDRSGQAPAGVDPSSRTWEAGNYGKILDFVWNLDGINDGQRLYLAVLLFAYANNTGEHNLSGSIVDMGFVPQGQIFEFTVVDTCGYNFDPHASYGAFARRYEVSLQTLEKTYGLRWSDKGLGGLRDVEIRPDPRRPDSFIKIVPLILAWVSDPRCVVVGRDFMTGNYSLGVLTTPKNGQVIAKLNLNDFVLSPWEQNLRQVSLLWGELREALFVWRMPRSFDPGKYYRFTQQRQHDRRFWYELSDSRFQNKKLLAAYLAREEANSKFFHLSQNVQRDILSARSKLKYLSPREGASLLKEIDDFIVTIEDAVELSRRCFQRYPKVAGRVVSGTSLSEAAVFIERTRAFLTKLKSLRANLSDTTLLPAVTSDSPLGGVDFKRADFDISFTGSGAEDRGSVPVDESLSGLSIAGVGAEKITPEGLRSFLGLGDE